MRTLTVAMLALVFLAFAGRATAQGDAWGSPQGASFRCKSENFGYRHCSADVRDGVRLVRRISEAECVEGRTWGTDRNGVWVNRGCDGEFQAGGYGGNWGNGSIVRCKSDGLAYRHCTADTRGGVRLVRRISRVECIEGRNWGTDANGVWVARGCEAEFQAGGGWGQGQGPGRTVRCKSDDFDYRHCEADVRGGVRLVRRISQADCIEGRTWGTDRNGIWVSGGCEAEFQTQVGHGWGGGWGSGSTVRCKSDDFAYRHCEADTRGGVRLSRQISQTSCVQGRNWGYDRSGVWVDNGCEAEFRVGR